MATIKAYSDLEQSKKLAEILPLESADMTYYACVRDWRGNPVTPKWKKPANLTKEELALPCSNFQEYKYIPCWSLAALLSVLPAKCECMALEHINYGNNNKSYFMHYVGGENTDNYDNPIDACYEMILKLHELKML